jgi:uncharacterized membrane protein
VLYRWKSLEFAGGHEWQLRRNCILTPMQLALMLALAGTLSLVVATGWALSGVWWVLPFALLEVSGLAVAFYVFSRHATDMDRVVVDNEQITIEQVDGLNRNSFKAPLSMVRIAYTQRKKKLIEVRVGGKHLFIGRFVPENQRLSLASEIAGVLGVPVSAR